MTRTAATAQPETGAELPAFSANYPRWGGLPNFDGSAQPDDATTRIPHETETESALCDEVVSLARARRFGDLLDLLPRVADLAAWRAAVALDAGFAGAVDSATDAPGSVSDRDGLWLVQPPMIGAEAVELRRSLIAGGARAIVLCREPRAKRVEPHVWPIVAAVAPRGVRARVEPPTAAVPSDRRWTGDDLTSSVDACWFRRTLDDLGEACVASVDPAQPAAWQAVELAERFAIVSESSHLARCLASAARLAISQPDAPPYRGPTLDDPWSF